MRILSLESSTSAAKALLYDTDSGISRIETVSFLAEYNRPDGTQDAEGVFAQTVEAAKRVCSGEQVDLIALVGAWHSVLLCDRAMRPVTPVYSWAATHAKEICGALREDSAYVNAYYQNTGCMVNAIYPYFKLRYLAAQGYALNEYYILGQGSYNTYRLSGKRVVSDCMASGSGMMNIRDRKWDASLLKSLGIEEDQLSEIVHYDQVLSLSADGAALLGLRAGIPLIAACSDGGMNQMAIGGYREGVMSFSVGTSAAIRLTTSAPVLPEHPATWCYLSPVGYLSGAATSGACNCISWYKDAFLPHMSFADLEQACGTYGMDTPVFLPFLFGERCPGWEDARKGGFMNISAEHGPVQLYQAIREGVLFNVYQCFCKLLTANLLKPRIILSGGILSSPSWTQMCADLFDHVMEIPTIQQSSLWGGVVLGAMYLRGAQAADALISGCSQVVPNEARHAHYMRKYQSYLEMYVRSSGGYLAK